MQSSFITILLTVAAVAVLAEDSSVSRLAVGAAGGSPDRGPRGTPAFALHRARLISDASVRRRSLVVFRRRTQRRRQDVQHVQDPIELDGLVEKSHLFTADPEAASAGKLYRQLALYPAEPAAPSDDLSPREDNSSSQKPEEEEEEEEKSVTGDTPTEEEYLLDNGDYGRRLRPDVPSTALPAYPPYSHGPLAVPVEPYRSPEYGPASGEGRRAAPVQPEPRQTARTTKRPVPSTTSPTEPQTPAVPLQGVEEEPPTAAPEQVSVETQEPTGYPTKRPTPRQPYIARLPVKHRSPVKAKPTKQSRPPQKAAAPSLYKPGSVYYPTRTYYISELNEVRSEPLSSPHGPQRPAHGLPRPAHGPPRPAHGLSRPLVVYRPGVSGGRYHHPPTAEYRHYSGLRQAKKSGGFERVKPLEYETESAADVSYGARTGNDGAFQWFSDYPVGSAHH